MLLGTVCMANAQDGIQLGVRAGLNINSFSEGKLDSHTGYHVGVVADCNVAKNLYVQPGLFFTTRGAKSEFNLEHEGIHKEAKYNMNYLQIPVSLSYRFPFFDLGVGPYVAMGIGGKLKWERSSPDGSWKGEENIFGGDSGLKRFDAGLRLGASVHLQNISIGFIYDLGLVEFASGEDGNPKNRSFQISLGYYF